MTELLRQLDVGNPEAEEIVFRKQFKKLRQIASQVLNTHGGNFGGSRRFEEPATVPPTGSMLGRPPDAVAWTGSTKPTVKSSKISMSIRWSVMPGDTYAAIPPGKQIEIVRGLPGGI